MTYLCNRYEKRKNCNIHQFDCQFPAAALCDRSASPPCRRNAVLSLVERNDFSYSRYNAWLRMPRTQSGALFFYWTAFGRESISDFILPAVYTDSFFWESHLTSAFRFNTNILHRVATRHLDNQSKRSSCTSGNRLHYLNTGFKDIALFKTCIPYYYFLRI